MKTVRAQYRKQAENEDCDLVDLCKDEIARVNEK
jgi:hypothetical protein